MLRNFKAVRRLAKNPVMARGIHSVSQSGSEITEHEKSVLVYEAPEFEGFNSLSSGADGDANSWDSKVLSSDLKGKYFGLLPFQMESVSNFVAHFTFYPRNSLRSHLCSRWKCTQRPSIWSFILLSSMVSNSITCQFRRWFQLPSTIIGLLPGYALWHKTTVLIWIWSMLVNRIKRCLFSTSMENGTMKESIIRPLTWSLLSMRPTGTMSSTHRASEKR